MRHVDVFRKAFWKAKPGPVLRMSRWCHFLFMFGCAAGCGLFGYDHLGWSAIAVIGAFAWEAGTPIWGGYHPFGDVIDLMAFLLGWVSGGVLALVSYAVRAPSPLP